MRLEYFQLIDRVVDLDISERRISCEATVPSVSTVFEGHFPGFPLMPGVLLVEAMAQTSGWLVSSINKFKRMSFLASVKEAKLRTFVLPGYVLNIESKLVHEGSGYAVLDAKVKNNGKQVCDATITLRVMEFPNQELAGEMLKMAARVGLTPEMALNG